MYFRYFRYQRNFVLPVILMTPATVYVIIYICIRTGSDVFILQSLIGRAMSSKHRLAVIICWKSSEVGIATHWGQSCKATLKLSFIRHILSCISYGTQATMSLFNVFFDRRSWIYRICKNWDIFILHTKYSFIM